jgi:hypothetical protein
LNWSHKSKLCLKTVIVYKIKSGVINRGIAEEEGGIWEGRELGREDEIIITL